jgi:5'-methylthioadenosine phosphorylase
MKHSAEIGVFGGSGFYNFLDKVEEVKIETPYGLPSAKIAIADVDGKKVAFLPRHGIDHSIPPHMINYRANVWAMKSLGVKCIIGPNAAGSLQPEIAPGDFVIIDQFVDRTKHRKDTFYDGPIATHVSPAECYCSDLRKVASKSCNSLGITAHDKGTVVVIEGPRFSTKAESKWFSSLGWEVINMTQYPEGYLAREQEMCYVCISLITDYDAGLDGEVAPVSAEEVMNVFNGNLDKLRQLLFDMIKNIDLNRNCNCGEVLSSSRF